MAVGKYCQRSIRHHCRRIQSGSSRKRYGTLFETRRGMIWWSEVNHSTVPAVDLLDYANKLFTANFGKHTISIWCEGIVGGLLKISRNRLRILITYYLSLCGLRRAIGLLCVCVSVYPGQLPNDLTFEWPTYFTRWFAVILIQINLDGHGRHGRRPKVKVTWGNFTCRKHFPICVKVMRQRHGRLKSRLKYWKLSKSNSTRCELSSRF